MLLGLLLALAPPLPAAERQVYFEQTVVAWRDGRAQGPGVQARAWHAGRWLRLESGEEGGPALVLRLDEGRGLRLDPATRTAAPVDLEALRERARLDLGLAGELLGGLGEERPRVTRLPEGKVIAGYACRGYRIRAGSARVDLYLTRALPVGMEAFAEFLRWSGARESLGALLGEVERLRGFPLETRSRLELMGEVHETVSTVTRVRVGPARPALFAPPPGYRLVDASAGGAP